MWYYIGTEDGFIYTSDTLNDQQSIFGRRRVSSVPPRDMRPHSLTCRNNTLRSYITWLALYMRYRCEAIKQGRLFSLKEMDLSELSSCTATTFRSFWSYRHRPDFGISLATPRFVQQNEYIPRIQHAASEKTWLSPLYSLLFFFIIQWRREFLCMTWAFPDCICITASFVDRVFSDRFLI